LARLSVFLLRNRFDIVHVSTPKAGLLGAIAARLTGHRRLLYTVRGRAYENMAGWARRLLMWFEWLSCSLAKRVLAISRELAATVVSEKLCPEHKIGVLGSGSSNGVDLAQFSRTVDRTESAFTLRKQLGISGTALVILAVGRIRRDKGINELVTAFDRIAEHRADVHLVLLGVYESEDPLDVAVVEKMKAHRRIHHVDWIRDPAYVYAAADILAFPSYREGFGNVALEASAMEVPVVASNIMGCREAVADGLSGLLVPPADADALQEALERLLGDEALRVRLGRQGRARVEREFRSEIVWAQLEREYRSLLRD
jgi:glycosyltransferase involved in cell wall biosynthesis